MNPIVALVGPSGAGKTTLIDRVIAQMPDKLDRVISFTTRAKRTEADSLYYEFVTREEVGKRKAEDIVVQLVEFSGNYYGTDRPHVEGVLKNKIGILAVVEHGIQTYINAGIPIIVIKIEPVGYKIREGRADADKLREQIPIKIDKTIINDFSNGGLERASQELNDCITSL